MQLCAFKFSIVVSIISMLVAMSACCDKKSIPQAKQRLYSGSAKDRNDAALELARCGSAARSAVHRLSVLLYDENVGVQSSAAYALRQIDTPEAREVLELATSKRGSGK